MFVSGNKSSHVMLFVCSQFLPDFQEVTSATINPHLARHRLMQIHIIKCSTRHLKH